VTDVATQLKAEAGRLGFIACGIAHLGPHPHAAALDRWLDAGYAGTMRYLHRQAKKRKAPQLADEQAGVAVVVLDPYPDPGPDDPARPRIARYARGHDYHRVTGDRLETLARACRRLGASHTRVYVDTGPVPERELARRAGLGWIGKNAMLIRPGAGSWCFIGVILTDLAVPPDPEFSADHCGTCTRCLEACPTGAFVAPRVLDATRCLSYLTIEWKGDIPGELAGRAQGWAFGCDVCNAVCPWNQRFGDAEGAHPFADQHWIPADAGPDYFERMTEAEFAVRFGGTPLERTGLERLRRNWAVAFGSLPPRR
jgi:epoxyqueuosine reductase